MSYLPIFLNLKESSILVVGGGSVALQKIKNLIQFTKNITIVSPCVQEEIKSFKLPILEEEYKSHHLKNIQIVFACTSSDSTNSQVLKEAHSQNILVQTVHHPKESDFISPAIFSFNKIFFALSSLGKDLKKTVSYRNILRKFLENTPNFFEKSQPK